MLAIVIEIGIVLWLLFSIRQRDGVEEGFWNRDEMKAARGFMTLIIMIFHVPVTSAVYSIIGKTSHVLIVTLFSMYSSYGVSRRWHDGNNVSKASMLPRLENVALPYLISIFVKSIITGNPFSGGTMWINTLLLFYVTCWFFSSVFLTNNTDINKDGIICTSAKIDICIMCFWLVYSVVVHFAHCEWFGWAAQSLGFVYGIILCRYEKEIWRFFRELSAAGWIVGCIVCMTIIILLGYRYLNIYESTVVTDSMYYIWKEMTFFEVVVVVGLGMLYSVRGRFISFVGDISLWCYLWHGLIVDLLNDYFSDGCLMFFVCLLTIILSWISKVLFRMSRNVICNHISQRNNR